MGAERKIIEYVRSRGCIATSARDAAHEAAHAILTSAESWDREIIHQAVLHQCPSTAYLLSSEVDARVVERLICLDLGIEHALERWAFIAMMETQRHFGLMVSAEVWATAVENRMASGRLRLVADRILCSALVHSSR